MAHIKTTDLFTKEEYANVAYQSQWTLKTRVELFDNKGNLVQEHVTYGYDLDRSYQAANMAVKYIHFDIINPMKRNGEQPIMDLLTVHFEKHGNPVPFAAKGPVM